MNQQLSVKIPADVDMPDRVLGRLTARQVVILVAAAGIAYGVWCVGHAVAPGVPAGVYVVVGLLVAGAAVAVAFGRRDGTSLEVLARAGITYRLRARHLRPRGTGSDGSSRGEVPGWAAGRAKAAAGYPGAPREGTLRLPAQAITSSPVGAAGDVGLIDLGGQGWAVIAAASTIPVGLRSPDEQQGVIDCFARLLHAQTGPMQILIRAHALDLTPALDELANAAARLTHPALAAAAASHHAWLAAQSGRAGTPLLGRQVLIVLREPALPTPPGRIRHTQPRRDVTAALPQGSISSTRGAGSAARTAAARLAHRLTEVERALAPAEITVVALDPEQVETVLASTADPARRSVAHTARARPTDRSLPRRHPQLRRTISPDTGDRGWAA